MNAPIRHADAFHKLIHENHMYGLWEIASQMTPQPRPEAIPHLWKWSLLERVVEASCTAVPVGDERRAMQLFNPGLKDQIAFLHHDLLSLHGGVGAVEGEKVVMQEGDLVLT